MEVVVRDVRVVAPRVKSFVLADPSGAALPAFTAGSHVDVETPAGTRSYSLLNDCRVCDHYEIAVLRESAGRGGSDWLHDQVGPGTRLTIGAPANLFELDEGGDHHILIAGGIGVTPLLSMAAKLDELNLDFRFYYLTRSREETAFAERIEALFADRLHLHHSVENGRFDVEELLRVRPPGTHVYVCGPAGLIAAVRAAAREWPQGTVHFELFGITRASTAENRPFDIHLRRRNLTLHVPAERSILDVLTANGVRVRTVCNDGFCGTCTTRYVSGVVDHRDGVLDDTERKTLLQVCVSRSAREGDVLVLDL